MPTRSRRPERSEGESPTPRLTRTELTAGNEVAVVCEGEEGAVLTVLLSPDEAALLSAELADLAADAGGDRVESQAAQAGSGAAV